MNKGEIKIGTKKYVNYFGCARPDSNGFRNICSSTSDSL